LIYQKGFLGFSAEELHKFSNYKNNKVGGFGFVFSKKVMLYVVILGKN
jgi:hypothetical protein